MSKSDFEKCPVETAIDLLTGKWKILIIWYLKDEKKDLVSLKSYYQKQHKRC